MTAKCEPLVDIARLTIRAAGKGGMHPLVSDVDLCLLPGQRLGLLGASGSGKSTICRALLGFFPDDRAWTAERFRLFGRQIAPGLAGVRVWEQLRGSQLTLVLQDAKHALNPVVRVGDQIIETLRSTLGRKTALARAEAMLAEVRIDDPRHVLDAFPHEISGGMAARVMLAMMLIAEPRVIVADEPTAALDSLTRKQVLQVFNDVIAQRNASLVLVSHDIDMLASFCDEVLVLRGGRIVDQAPAAAVYASAQPYTRRLVAAVPRLERFHG